MRAGRHLRRQFLLAIEPATGRHLREKKVQVTPEALRNGPTGEGATRFWLLRRGRPVRTTGEDMISMFMRRLLGITSAVAVAWSTAFVVSDARLGDPAVAISGSLIARQASFETVRLRRDLAVMDAGVLLANLDGGMVDAGAIFRLDGAANPNLDGSPSESSRSPGRATMTTPPPFRTTTTSTVDTTSSTTSSSTSSTEATTTTTQATTDLDGAVELRPGDDVASIVDGAPSGTTFLLTTGVYTAVSIRPKADMVFQGEPGAIFQGQGKPYAFSSGASGVTVRGLVIEGYQPAEKEAAIHPEGGATNWTVENNEIRENGEVGIKANDGWRIANNYIHHNGRYGVTGSGSGIAIVRNEISYNSTDYGATGASGGTKFVHTTGLVLQGNYVHHNYGNGLWVDINNVTPLIEGNRVVANERNGIFIEISCGGIIRNNDVEGNGTKPKLENWMGGSSGILVSMTPDVEVYGNIVTGNDKGIGAVHWDHDNVGSVTHCNPQLRNLRVHDNEIIQSGGAAAGVDASKDEANVFGPWDNQFYANSYTLTNGAQFRWGGEWISFQEWQDLGQM